MAASIPLRRATLGELPPILSRPTYDLGRRRIGLVHLGCGAFHRAHMARFTHDLMERRPDALEWAIAGVGLLPSDQAVRDALVPQDGLYTLVERDVGGERATVIGSIATVIHAAENIGPLLELIDQPGVRIVSLTVTEVGYGLDPATKRLDPTLPAIAADLAAPGQPRSPVGVVVEGLRRRRAAGRPAFTALSCDNIQHNGTVLRRAVLDFAAAVDGDLARWIEDEGRFPNTMVDRITPVTRPEDVAHVAKTYGVADAWPVVCEPFRQWIIEDDFVGGRPDWDEVGAQFTRDVAPYEGMKLRLLNASHLAIAGLGRLAGYERIDEIMGDAAMRRYVRALMDRETGPTVGPVPGIDLDAYKASLVERFSNPAIRDTADRVNTDAPLNYLLDPLRDRLAAGSPIDLLALAIAAWMRRVRGVDDLGQPIPVKHVLAKELRTRALEGGPDPRPPLGLRSLFGDLSENRRFVEILRQWLASLHEVGVFETLERAATELKS